MPAPQRTVRQRKLAKTTLQQVLREDEIDSVEYNSLQTQAPVETGVEKGEEKEYHLQAALAANSRGDDKDVIKDIPAPCTEESADINYDALYAEPFNKPATYIRFSQTVEECTGCQYDMTTEDDIFLKAYNQKRPNTSKLSEEDFEKLMDLYEEEALLQAPYASVDGTVIQFDAFQPSVKQQLDQKIQVFAQDVYEHWRNRRQESGNNALQPSLKMEKDIARDDGDPYVCFRRRDGRVTRKTRGRDVQSVDKLKKLRKEIEEGRILIAMALQREQVKRELLIADQSIFQMRAEVKRNKIKLGIKTDDEDLINQKPQKRKTQVQQDFTQQLQRAPGGQMRFPGRSDGRPLDADLILLSDVIASKENALRAEIEEKAEQHRKWNINHIDLTREPLSPVAGQGSENGFRPATAQYQYLMTPPSSVTSESFDHPLPSQEAPEPILTRYNSPPEEDRQGQPAYRRRFGRGGRLWIDRRGMPSTLQSLDSPASDQWKYDQDDGEEQPIYEVDAYDTKALKFRATIPFPHHLLPQRGRQDDRSAQSRAITVNPPNGRAINNAPAQTQLLQASQSHT